jgi:predicted transcriptional regulator
MMMIAHDRMCMDSALVDARPDDAAYEEIVRELAFERMVERGLDDARRGRTLTNEEMGRRVRQF